MVEKHKCEQDETTDGSEIVKYPHDNLWCIEIPIETEEISNYYYEPIKFCPHCGDPLA